MEKYIIDERTGLKYELVGEYYFIAGDDEPTKRPIGIWGQRHLRHAQSERSDALGATDERSAGNGNENSQ